MFNKPVIVELDHTHVPHAVHVTLASHRVAYKAVLPGYVTWDAARLITTISWPQKKQIHTIYEINENIVDLATKIAKTHHFRNKQHKKVQHDMMPKLHTHTHLSGYRKLYHDDSDICWTQATRSLSHIASLDKSRNQVHPFYGIAPNPGGAASIKNVNF